MDWSSQKTKELESIIALKSRQLVRLQKEVKSLLHIQQQQANTIENSFHDSRELEERLHSYETRAKTDERTIKVGRDVTRQKWHLWHFQSLQDKLTDVTSSYQKILTSYTNSVEEKRVQTGKRASLTKPKLESMGRSGGPNPLSNAPLPPVGDALLGPPPTFAEAISASPRPHSDTVRMANETNPANLREWHSRVTMTHRCRRVLGRGCQTCIQIEHQRYTTIVPGFYEDLRTHQR